MALFIPINTNRLIERIEDKALEIASRLVIPRGVEPRFTG